MPKRPMHFHVFLLAAILLSGCTSTEVASVTTHSAASTTQPANTLAPTRSAASSFTPLPTITYTATPLPTETNTVTPLPTGTPTVIPTPTLITTISEWYTYTSPTGVSIQYPAGWYVNVHGYPPDDSVSFKLYDTPNVSRYYWINLEIYNRPPEQRSIADPHTWQPNEGGYEIQWEKPLWIDNIPGIEFVWGAYDEGLNQWDSWPSLDAILYSPSYQLDIRLSTGFDRETLDLAMVVGFEEAIQMQKYFIFEYMLQSISVTP